MQKSSEIFFFVLAKIFVSKNLLRHVVKWKLSSLRMTEDKKTFLPSFITFPIVSLWYTRLLMFKELTN